MKNVITPSVCPGSAGYRANPTCSWLHRQTSMKVVIQALTAKPSRSAWKSAAMKCTTAPV